MKLLKTLFCIMLFASTLSVKANQRKKFSEYLQEKIRLITPALNVESTDSTSTAWDFQNFYLRLNTNIRFKFFFLGSIQIEPTVEFVWHRIPVQPQ